MECEIFQYLIKNEDFEKKYKHLKNDYKKTFEFDYDEELSISLYLNSLNSNGDIDFQTLFYLAEIYDITNDLELSERSIAMKRAARNFESKLDSIVNNDAAKKMKEEINRRYKKSKK